MGDFYIFGDVMEKYEKIKLCDDKNKLFDILKNDLSLNYQLGLHNSVVFHNPTDLESAYQTVDSIFSNGFWNKGWSSLNCFITPFGDVSEITDKFYYYNYYNELYHQNYIFAFPKVITLNNKDYFLGNLYLGECILNNTLFDFKNVPKEFIYGVIVFKGGYGAELIKNPDHLSLKNDREQEEFYDNWLTSLDKKVLESVNTGDYDAFSSTSCNHYFIQKTIKQKNKMLQKKK